MDEDKPLVFHTRKSSEVKSFKDINRFSKRSHNDSKNFKIKKQNKSNQYDKWCPQEVATPEISTRKVKLGSISRMSGAVTIQKVTRTNSPGPQDHSPSITSRSPQKRTVFSHLSTQQSSVEVPSVIFNNNNQFT